VGGLEQLSSAEVLFRDRRVLDLRGPRRPGRGIGRQLLEALADEARGRGYWKLVARIFPFNEASRRLCRASGFREVGVYEKHGRLDGRWTDVIIVERLIQENLDE
jgi:L-amino acid N-acyltransferase YncA